MRNRTLIAIAALATLTGAVTIGASHAPAQTNQVEARAASAAADRLERIAPGGTQQAAMLAGAYEAHRRRARILAAHKTRAPGERAHRRWRRTRASGRR